MRARPSSFVASSAAVAVCLAVLAAPAACGGSDSSTENPVTTPEAGVSTDSATPDTMAPTTSCATGRTACGTVCVDTKTDVKNCGSCAKACNAGELCAASACVTPTGFAARKIYLGDTDRTGASSTTAWKDLGRNIDGLTSLGATPNGECMRVGGAPASTADDGNGGIDNAFGKTIIPFLLALAPTPSQVTSTILEGGGQTLLIDLGTAPKHDLAAFALGLETASATIAPQWNGGDTRMITAESSTAGKASTILAGTTIVAGLLTTTDSAAPYVLSVSFGGSSLNLPVHVARLSMTLAADNKTASATLSGVVGTEEMVTAFRQVAGSISTSLCSGSTLDTIETTIRQASDIFVDGTQNAGTACNGISVGVGFDAVAVGVGAVAAAAGPIKDPCAP